MKILFITSQVITKHATMKRALGLYMELVSLGHSVTILLEDHEDNKKECDLLKIHNTIFYKKSNFINELVKKNTIVYRNNFDIIYICGLGFRNIIINRNSIIDHVELESSINTNKIKRYLPRILELFSFNFYKYQVCVSKFLCDHVQKYTLIKRPVKYILYFPYAHMQETDYVISDKINNIINNRKVIVFSGGWWRNYGFHTMLLAVHEVLKNNDQIVAVFTGRGPEKDYGENFIKTNNLHNKLYLLGYLESKELSYLFSQASLFLCPLNNTIQDIARCPSKIFMYMQYDKPIVTAAVGEPIHYFSDSSTFYKAGDYYDMARVIKSIIDNPNWKPNYNKFLHTWNARAIQLDNWLKSL